MVSWRNWSANRCRPSRPSFSPERRIAGQAQDRRGEPFQVAGREQDAGLGKDDLAGAVDVVADHRPAHQERLRKHPRQPLAQAGVDHRIDRATAARGSGREEPVR